MNIFGENVLLQLLLSVIFPFFLSFFFKTMKIPSCIGGLIHREFGQQYEKIPRCLRQRSLDGFRIAVDTCKTN